jgi:hypothetical protein
MPIKRINLPVTTNAPTSCFRFYAVVGRELAMETCEVTKIEQREPAKGELPSVVDLPPGALQKQTYRELLDASDQPMVILS